MRKALEWVFKGLIIGVGVLIGLSLTTSFLGPIGLGAVIIFCTAKLVSKAKIRKGGVLIFRVFDFGMLRVYNMGHSFLRDLHWV